MCPLSEESAKSSAVLDREIDQEKSLDPSGPLVRCPLCGWSPRKDDHWSCTCGHSWNTLDTGGVPRLPAQLDFNTVSVVYPLVSTFRLVCAVMKHSKQKDESR